MITPDNSIAKFKTKCHKFCLCHICHFKMKCSVLQNDKLLDKILDLHDNSIVKLVYMEHYKDAMDNININWVFLVKVILETHGFSHVWQQQCVPNVNKILSEFKQNVDDIFSQNCNDQIYNSSDFKNV